MSKSKLPKSNREISAQNVRLVDSTGEMLGVVTLSDALEKARAENLDLVEISPNAEPPVCKILDFGKYKYEMQKRAHEAKKKQRTIDIKEIKIRPNISDHDYQIKLRKVLQFLEHGDKVKISMRFRGREIAKQDIALSIMKNVAIAIEGKGKVETNPRLESRQMLMILAPLTA
ncbi:MAG: translation initiation factor IF-3 [Rickettsiales bacterium]|jgi:translation initiation factor IF-3|nr:translation initiation factor IF-3 [Rickettsiales bacterium]